jgi:ABC-type multidrug transport system ATPase subunit
VDTLFAEKSQLLIGRAPECDICLPHPTISRHHARLERRPAGLELRDLGSVNGVILGGHPIAAPVLLKENQRVGIGPFLFCLSGGSIHVLDSSKSLRLEARNLEKVVPQPDGRMRKLLDDINLAIEPGEFVSLLGPSGSGKSTLMDCLNGRRPATGGSVLANGEDFYLHFDSFRQSLGYVPQKDIVHTQLTVYKALYYTARLRLPTDTGPSELRSRIEEVMQLMELVPHRETLVANLSGGQIKRVSLGAELLARPCLLYIDEATSGLDAGTEARMMRLFRHLADEGKSVICITHNVDNVDLCNLVLILARGKLVYYGPPAEARSYFCVSRISDIYDRLGEKEPDKWEREFAVCSLFQQFVEKRLTVKPSNGAASPVLAPTIVNRPASASPPSSPERLPSTEPSASSSVDSSSSLSVGDIAAAAARTARQPLWHQFRVLTARYAELIWRDGRGFRLLLMQAPIVAIFILLGFVGKDYEKKLPVPRALKPEERDTLTKVAKVLERVPDYTKLTEKQRAALQAINLSREGDPPIIALDLVKGIQKVENAQMLQKILETPADTPAVPDRSIVNPRYTYMLLFLLVITILWFGCNNAAKEIVKEEAIYGRERAVNLGILPYLASKFLILTLITAVQVLMLMLLTYGVMELLHIVVGLPMPHPFSLDSEGNPLGYCLAYPEQFGVLVLLSMTGVALGLLLSACVATPDRANALLPYVLIPQIILGGGIMPINNEPLHTIALTLSPAYWAYRAVRRGASYLPGYVPGHSTFNDSVWLACGALLVQLTVLLLLTAWFLRQKDVRRA